ncbi:MAG: hypothetical protein IAG13_18135, partial [Deltaproteobacteria bacterium]|nr:hypothetical protein [Nannocystaceae bacterium]
DAPELAEAPALGRSEYLFGRTASYFRQLERHDLRQAWRDAGVPALLLHGDRDLVTNFDDHLAIAELLTEDGVTARAAELAGFGHDMAGPDGRLVHETIAFVHSVCGGD